MAAYLEGNIICENHLLALLDFLFWILLVNKLHAVGIACLQLRPVSVPLAVVFVFSLRTAPLRSQRYETSPSLDHGGTGW